jgi:hypothetical protein
MPDLFSVWIFLLSEGGRDMAVLLPSVILFHRDESGKMLLAKIKVVNLYS